MKCFIALGSGLACVSALMLAPSINAASIITVANSDFVSSSNNTTAGAGFNVSVEGTYSGYKGEYDDGGGAPGAESSGSFGTVTAYRFWGVEAGSASIGTVAQGGTIIGDVNTTDVSFQNASFLSLWVTTASNGNNFDTTADIFSGATSPVAGTSVNNLDQGATGSVDISGLASGTVYFIYGAYRSKPSFSISMGATDLGDVHAAGVNDSANNNEWYIAEVDFVNEGDQTSIDWELAAGSNGRWSGIVVANTTPIPEPGSLALLGLGGLLIARRRRG